MPFLSPKRRVSDAENKLRLLLCLRALGMATSDQLWPFVAELELMEYLPYCLLLDELKKRYAAAQTLTVEYAGELPALPDGVTLLESQPGRAVLRADGRRITASALIGRLSDAVNILDLSVTGATAEELVVGLYREFDI